VVSFPAISTGVYGYPVEEAAPIAISAAREHLEREDTGVQKVVFVLYDQATYDAFARALEPR
jgi:O-acetyl-ADP-ribose deacetylase (regulator of RNase III)